MTMWTNLWVFYDFLPRPVTLQTLRLPLTFFVTLLVTLRVRTKLLTSTPLSAGGKSPDACLHRSSRGRRGLQRCTGEESPRSPRNRTCRARPSHRPPRWCPPLLPRLGGPEPVVSCAGTTARPSGGDRAPGDSASVYRLEGSRPRPDRRLWPRRRGRGSDRPIRRHRCTGRSGRPEWTTRLGPTRRARSPPATAALGRSATNPPPRRLSGYHKADSPLGAGLSARLARAGRGRPQPDRQPSSRRWATTTKPGLDGSERFSSDSRQDNTREGNQGERNRTDVGGRV